MSDAAPAPTFYKLPDLNAVCPIKDEFNPWLEELGQESRDWIKKFKFSTPKKRAFFESGRFELLCAHVYGYAGYEQFRTACDFINLLFAIDEISDYQNSIDAEKTGVSYVEAMKDPNWDDGSEMAAITKDYRKRYVKLAGPRSFKRWLVQSQDYMDGVKRVAELRTKGQHATLEEWVPLRRKDSAMGLCAGIAEALIGVDLDEEIFSDPDFDIAYWAVTDFVCWSNEAYSYDFEQHVGQLNGNLVNVLMKEKNLDLQGAIDYIGRECTRQINDYVGGLERLRARLGPEADAVRYIKAIGHWIIGNIEWSFGSNRYFGENNKKVRETLIVPLRPRFEGVPTPDDGVPDDFEGTA